MGASASADGKMSLLAEHPSLAQTLHREAAMPVDGADIDTPRGESAKAEVRRLRKLLRDEVVNERSKTKAIMGSAPSLEDYLRSVFTLADRDGNKVLSAEEFWTMLEGLGLDLNPKELSRLQRLTDTDGDKTVSLEEFIAAAPTYFQRMAEEEHRSHYWVQLEDPTGAPFFYNKQTRVSQYQAPAEYLENLAAAAKEQEASMPPGIKEYVHQMFQDADTDGSGTLSADEFFDLLINGLNLGITEERGQLLLEKFDVDEDNIVNWEEFVVALPELLRQINEGKSEDDCWFMLQVPTSTTPFYANTKSLKSQWRLPTDTEKAQPRVSKSQP